MIRKLEFKIDWLFLFLLILPLFYYIGMDTRGPQTEFFQFSIIFLLALMHVNKWFGAFLGWSLFQFLFFKDMPQNSMALNNLFLGAVAYQIIFLFSEKIEVKKYALALYIVLGINLVWCVRQYYQIDPIFQMANQQFQTKFTEYQGFFGLPAFLGNFVAIISPLAFLLTPWLLPFCVAGIIVSKSTFSALAFLCGVLFYLWFHKRLSFWILLVVGILSFSFYAIKYDYPTGEFSRRLKVWQMVERISFQKPILGHGIGSYESLLIGEVTPDHDLVITKNPEDLRKFIAGYAAHKGHDNAAIEILKENHTADWNKILQARGLDFQLWKQAHNDFLEAFHDGGILGLIFIFGYIVDMFKRFFQWGRKDKIATALIGSLIAIIIVANGHFPFHLTRLAGPCLVVMVLLDITLLRLKTAKEEW